MIRRLVLGIITFLVTLTSCSGHLIKLAPEYKGVDERARPYLNKYLSLSSQNHIAFKNRVTLGFRKIDKGATIGYCTFGAFFREIDLDIDYWNSSSDLSKLALIFHEAGHCYCGREHDYGDGLAYPDDALMRLKVAIYWTNVGGPKPGYWDDGCPISLMYPIIVDDDCMQSHYEEYVKELFSRCDPF